MLESFFVIFWLFFIANIVLVIWALIDAIRVPDESMYKAGNRLIWVLVILLGGFVGADRLSRRRAAVVGQPSIQTIAGVRSAPTAPSLRHPRLNSGTAPRDPFV